MFPKSSRWSARLDGNVYKICCGKENKKLKRNVITIYILSVAKRSVCSWMRQPRRTRSEYITFGLGMLKTKPRQTPNFSRRLLMCVFSRMYALCNNIFLKSLCDNYLHVSSGMYEKTQSF